VLVDSGSQAPELTTFTFRIRAVNQDLVSGYSNDATARSLLIAPTIDPPASGWNGISVSWQNHSLIADTLKLERGTSRDAAGTWTTIPGVPFGATSWTDRTAQEGASYYYRITYAKGADTIQATSFYDAPMLLLAPEQLTASPLSGGVGLAWANPSRAASQVAVLRASGLDANRSFQEVALLPATQTSFVDSGLTAGYYQYRLEHRRPGWASVPSETIPAATLPPQNSASLQPVVITLPEANVVRRSSKGNWVLSGPYPWEVRLREPFGNGWVDFAPAEALRWFAPYFLLDSRDFPHLVYSAPSAADAQRIALVHAWRNSDGWQREEITTPGPGPESDPSILTFTLDAQDRLHLLWRTGALVQDLEYAFKGQDGRWFTEPVDNPSPPSLLWQFRLEVDPTGQPHVLIGTDQEVQHLTRSNGAWGVEVVPVNGAMLGAYSLLESTAPAPDACIVFVRRDRTPYDGTMDLLMLRKEAGTWLPEEILFNSPVYPLFTASLTSSRDGTRLGLLHSAPGGNLLHVWTSGIWTDALVGPYSFGTPHMGFSPLNKLFLLMPAGAGESPSAYPYVLYQEQP